MGIWKIRKSRCDDNALNSKFLKNQLWPTEKKGKNKNNKNDFFYFQNMETLENKNVVKVVNGFMSVNLWPSYHIKNKYTIIFIHCKIS